MTCRVESGQTWRQTYNAQNRLAKVEQMSGDCTTGTPGDTWSFYYDGNGTRVKQVNPDIKVVARISDPDFFNVFKELEVADLVYPEFEAGLEMIRQVLLYLRIPVPEIQHHTEHLRHSLLATAATSENGYRTLGQMRTAEQQFDLQWVELAEKSPLIGVTIAQAEIRKATGVSVVGIIRADKLATNPEPNFRFQQNDLVAIIGSAQARQRFHCFINPLSESCLQPAPAEPAVSPAPASGR